jgi:hypothetical protein
MARVTSAEVNEVIYLSSEFTEEIINQCISVANTVVTDKLDGEGASDDMLKHIELYLSAHFCSVREPQLTEEEIGGRDSTVKEKRRMAEVGYGFASTAFGQQAIALDETGILADMSDPDKKEASMTVYGPYDDEYTYDYYYRYLWYY